MSVIFRQSAAHPLQVVYSCNYHGSRIYVPVMSLYFLCMRKAGSTESNDFMEKTMTHHGSYTRSYTQSYTTTLHLHQVKI